MKYWLVFLFLLVVTLCSIAEDKPGTAANQPQLQPQPQNPAAKPRVFITDSESWEMRGSAGGANGAWAAESHGGARPQTAEIIKTFGERCPETMVNDIQAKADYIVVLDHEGGKGLLRHKNKVAVFARISGDSVVSKSTLSLGGSVQEACDAINRDWAANGDKLRAAAEAEKPKPTAAAVTDTPKSSTAKLSISSAPDGADIEVDGDFVGNTPSTVELAAGEHAVLVRKSGYKDWQRKIRLTGGEVRLNAEMEKVSQPSGEAGK
jgi:hypothetical protein